MIIFIEETISRAHFVLKEFQESKKCVGSMGSFLDLMKLDMHGGRG